MNLSMKMDLPGYRNYGIESLSSQQLEYIYDAAKKAGTSPDFLELIQCTLRKRNEQKD